MAVGKNGFILYKDLKHTLNKLSDDQAGRLFKHILGYVNDENPEMDDPLLDIVFEPIKQSLKRDLRKYEKTCEKNKGNALKRWNAIASDRIQPNANDADIDSDSVKDTDSVIEKGSKNNPAPRFVFKKSMIAYGFDEELVDEWMQVRKKKRLTNSKTAFEGFIREVEKTNLKPSGVLRQCVERSWGSFKASWLENEKKFSVGSETKEKNLFEKSAEYLNR